MLRTDEHAARGLDRFRYPTWMQRSPRLIRLGVAMVVIAGRRRHGDLSPCADARMTRALWIAVSGRVTVAHRGGGLAAIRDLVGARA